MLNCRQVTRLISQSMDAKLPWHRRLAIRVHLLYCVWCQRYAAQLQILREAARGLKPEGLAQPDQRLSPDAKQQMQSRLQEALRQPPSAPE